MLLVLQRPVEPRQYGSTSFADTCQRHGVRRSRGRIGSSFDNALAEAFFATLKRELDVDNRRWISEAEARRDVFRWIAFYNHRRRHSALDYCSPAEAQAIRSGLDRMEADARAAHGAGFTAITSEQQTALLTRYDMEFRARREGAFFPVLRELVTVGYFTSKIGATQAVRYDPFPGAYHGCVPLSEIGRAWAT